MAISKKKRYIEFQLAPNRGWYIAELEPKNRYRLLYAKSEYGLAYNKWKVDWTFLGRKVFMDCLTLEQVNEKYQILEQSFFTEDDLFIKLI